MTALAAFVMRYHCPCGYETEVEPNEGRTIHAVYHIHPARAGWGTHAVRMEPARALIPQWAKAPGQEHEQGAEQNPKRATALV